MPTESESGSSLIAFGRRPAAPPFSTREIALADLIRAEIPWLHHQSSASTATMATTTLSPRLKTVLSLLLRGNSRKQIADRLRISVNTVHGYTRKLYSHFEVSSHSALLQYCGENILALEKKCEIRVTSGTTRAVDT